MLKISRSYGYDVIDALIDAEKVARTTGDQLRGARLAKARGHLESQMNNKPVAAA